VHVELGTLHVTSPAGNGTTLLIEIPVEREDNPGAPESWRRHLLD
jgi:hypothetical protein